MAWVAPKTNWTVEPPLPTDFNRIEANQIELKKAATITIADSGSVITSTNVEDALQELHDICQ
jgi:hypothetical protein